MEPKYLLVFDVSNPYPFVIYEQAASYILTDEQKTRAVKREPAAIAQKFYRSFQTLENALREMAFLNGNVPVLLAYSNKPIDNQFNV